MWRFAINIKYNDIYLKELVFSVPHILLLLLDVAELVPGLGENLSSRYHVLCCHVTITLTSAQWQDPALTEVSAHSSSSPPAGSLCPGAGAVSQPAISHVVNITRTVLYHSELHCTHRNPYCAILTATPRTSILLFSEETSQSARQSVGRIGIIWLSSRRSWGRNVRSYDAVIITDTVYTSHAHYSLVYS